MTPVSSYERLPVAEGRYVVFVPCLKAAPNGLFVEPTIATWHGNKWHIAEKRPVVGWLGPLPVLKNSDFFQPIAKPEYDL